MISDKEISQTTERSMISELWLFASHALLALSHLDHASWGRVQAPQRVRRHLSNMSYFRTPWVMEYWANLGN